MVPVPAEFCRFIGGLWNKSFTVTGAVLLGHRYLPACRMGAAAPRRHLLPLPPPADYLGSTVSTSVFSACHFSSAERFLPFLPALWSFSPYGWMGRSARPATGTRSATLWFWVSACLDYLPDCLVSGFRYYILPFSTLPWVLGCVTCLPPPGCHTLFSHVPACLPFSGFPGSPPLPALHLPACLPGGLVTCLFLPFSFCRFVWVLVTACLVLLPFSLGYLRSCGGTCLPAAVWVFHLPAAFLPAWMGSAVGLLPACVSFSPACLHCHRLVCWISGFLGLGFCLPFGCRLVHLPACCSACLGGGGYALDFYLGSFDFWIPIPTAACGAYCVLPHRYAV